MGAGLTGLWTAYYLAKAVPELSVAILEKEFAGFGASGRNGGWLSGEPAGQFRRYAKAHGSHRAKELQQHMFSSIDEVIEVGKNEGIEADIVKDGLIHVATNNAQLRRLTHHVEELRTQGCSLRATFAWQVLWYQIKNLLCDLSRKSCQRASGGLMPHHRGHGTWLSVCASFNQSPPPPRRLLQAIPTPSARSATGGRAAGSPRAAALWLIFPTRPWLCGRQRRTPPWWDIRGRSCIPRRVRAWLPNPDGRGDG